MQRYGTTTTEHVAKEIFFLKLELILKKTNTSHIHSNLLRNIGV